MPGIEGFELPKSLEIDEATRTDTFARFTAEPWEHGFGNTIGNGMFHGKAIFFQCFFVHEGFFFR